MIFTETWTKKTANYQLLIICQSTKRQELRTQHRESMPNFEVKSEHFLRGLLQSVGVQALEKIIKSCFLM